MKPTLFMMAASALFALMGVCVKLASAHYGAGEIVLYRSIIGLLLMAGVLRARGISWRTQVPGMHFWRATIGTAGLCLWFYAIGVLPLATAMTLNYMSPVWIALFLIGGAVLAGPDERNRSAGLDGRLVAAVLAGFAGVAMVLRPTVDQNQLWGGLIGLLSGVVAAMAYLQVTALGRIGEPGERVVFYFSVGGCVAGLGLTAATGGLHAHTARGLGLLLAIGLLATMAQWLLTRAYATGATLGIAALQYLGIVYSFCLGVWLFHDPVTPLALAGMALIIVAGVAATLLSGRARAARDAAAAAAPTES
jgi:S-adenosylmethionine uptake transporter